jgi:hypothetical protein
MQAAPVQATLGRAQARQTVPVRMALAAMMAAVRSNASDET